MRNDTISILDGSTFVVSNRAGDIDAGPDQPQGLFFKDTRHLSRWILTVDDKAPDVLSTDDVEYYYAQFFLAPKTGTIYKNPYLSVIRRRMVGEGFVEDITVMNHDGQPTDVTLRLKIDSDFADLFEVKDHLEKKGKLYREVRDGKLVLGYRRQDFVRETRISTDANTVIDDQGLLFKLHLAPRTEWHTRIHVAPVEGAEEHTPKYSSGMAAAKPNLRQGLEGWILDAPRVASHPDAVRRLYARSMIDIAALRFNAEILPDATLPAAGLPWFMALFGRDSILTSYQCLPFAPELAATTLKVLAAAQGKKEDSFREEQPGKILHELRFGELTKFGERPQSPYYGASDTTALWLVLLDEYERWSGDSKLVKDLKPNAMACLEWIDHYGDRDGDGYIEYIRSTEEGLENQCWKDSWNSIMFANGEVSKAPRATCEIQGYTYDAKVRCARLAREIWGDDALAKRLLEEAADLKRRFDRDFWLPERQFYAIALDHEKRKVDSLTSNIGHLLWSGIVPEEKAALIAQHIMSKEMFSGWGIRTMAMGEAGFNPIEYHNGTVWPHDSVFVAAGLAKYGFREEASKVVSAVLQASVFFRFRLPEVFAGYERSRTVYPVEYPTASSPQAWAAGSPLHGIRVILGLEPKGEVLTSAPVLPKVIGLLAVHGIPGRWGRADVVAEREDAASLVEIAKVWFAERAGESDIHDR
jgi:glycogen debranching enzyme